MPIDAAAETDFDRYDPADERRRESLFGLGNGVLFVRACAPESGPPDLDVRAGERRHYPGTYAAGLYNTLTSFVDGERAANTFAPNLPNPLPLAARIAGGAWLNADDATPLRYRHRLDLPRALAERELLLRDAGGRTVHIAETRFVSMAQPNLIALRWRLTPVDWSGALELRSGIDGRIQNANVERDRAYAGWHLDDVAARPVDDDTLLLSAHLTGSPRRVALAARMRIDPAASTADARRLETVPDAIFELRQVDVRAGQTLTVDKLVAVYTPCDTTAPDPAAAALDALRRAAGFDALLAAHECAWRPVWRDVRIACDDPALARQFDLCAFHTLQTASPHTALRDAGFPARGWQEAYHGHVFWDDLFVMPLFASRCPEIARGLLLYRYRRLPAARAAARAAGRAGAMFPWRSAADGSEETPRHQFNPLDGRWLPDRTRLQRHVGAAIVWNLWTYFRTTGDLPFLCHYGAPLAVEVARFWADSATFSHERGRYEIRGVVGADEYHVAYPDAAQAGLDNNAYTNLMAVWSLRQAARIVELLPPRQCTATCEALALTDGELAHWRDVAARMAVPLRDDGVILQFDGFDRLLPFDGRGYALRHPFERLDWRLHARGDDPDRYQATKQADVLMLFHLLGDDAVRTLLTELGYPCHAQTRQRTFEFYAERMTHESSLSKIACAGAFARSDPDRSWRYFVQALRADTDPRAGGGAAEGLHLAAQAGALTVLQRHYAGIDFEVDALRLAPALPAALPPMHFAFLYRGGRFTVDVRQDSVRLTADASNPAAVAVRGDACGAKLAPGGSLRVAARRG